MPKYAKICQNLPKSMTRNWQIDQVSFILDKKADLEMQVDQSANFKSGFLWILMDFDGFLWIFVDFCGFLWIFCGF
jgi:hypothetical protein